jgi:hypothetical protein
VDLFISSPIRAVPHELTREDSHFSPKIVRPRLYVLPYFVSSSRTRSKALAAESKRYWIPMIQYGFGGDSLSPSELVGKIDLIFLHLRHQ